MHIRGKPIQILPVDSDEYSDSDSPVNEFPSKKQSNPQKENDYSDNVSSHKKKIIENHYLEQQGDHAYCIPNTEDKFTKVNLNIDINTLGNSQEIINMEHESALCELENNIDNSKMHEAGPSNNTMQQSDNNEDLAYYGRNRNNLTMEQEECTEEKKLSRKRARNPDKWACNIRKQNYDRGLEYISSRHKKRPARQIQTKKDCIDKCIYKCARIISEEQRNQLFEDYYKLSSKEKRMYILQTTERTKPERRRKGKSSENSRRGNTYNFFFYFG